MPACCMQELRESYRETARNLSNPKKLKADIEQLKMRLPEDMIVAGENGEEQVGVPSLLASFS